MVGVTLDPGDVCPPPPHFKVTISRVTDALWSLVNLIVNLTSVQSAREK